MACLSVGGNRYVPDFYWQKGTPMNPETLLHTIAEQLRAEAAKGPGTMFVVHVGFNLIVTRTPNPADVTNIVTKYDCEVFGKGLSSSQWAILLKKLSAANAADQKGAASATNH